MVDQPGQSSPAHAVFRGINERLYQLDVVLDTMGSEIVVVCECSRRECIERIALSTQRYEQLRLDGATAIVAVGHPADGERSAAGGDAYEVVLLQPR